MRIRRLVMDSESHRPNQLLDRVGIGVNVITGHGQTAAASTSRPSRRIGVNVITGHGQTAKSVLGALAAHLLYGRRTSLADQPNGSIDVESRFGNFRLRRETRSDRSCHLTIAGLDGDTVEADTITRLLNGVSPAFLSRLYYQDGTRPPAIDWLLSEGVAATVTRLCGTHCERTNERSIWPDQPSVGPLSLDELDYQILRWSTILQDLKRRESLLHTELATLSSIEVGGCVTLAERRATVAVTERLVNDLKSEIGRLARSRESQACLCRDAHARLQPLVALLEQQVTRLSQLTEAHERANRAQELRSEARQLDRSQTEIRDQLEYLRQQRETNLGRPHNRRENDGIRSSDVLAQLSDGQYVQIKLASGGRRAIVVDSRGQTRLVESLTIAERQLVALSLSLAILSGLNRSGIQLPLLLDEPFCHLNDRQAEMLASALHDLSDQQIFVWTQHSAAIEQFRSLGAIIHDLDNQPNESHRPGNTQPNVEGSSGCGSDSTLAPRIQLAQPEKPRRSKRASGKRSANKRNSSNPPTPLRFSLDLESSLDELPSIPRNIAEKLTSAGILRVHDLLKADASDLAARLEGEVEPAVIVSWQHHARLRCRIPNLAARDASILVHCGFSTPEDVAAMKSVELLAFIQSLASTEKGRQLLGVDGNPELTTVEHWIRSARHSRVLGAA